MRSEAKRQCNVRWSNSEKGKEYQRKYSNEWYRKRRFAILEKLGGKCIKCGYNKDWRALQIDHINGGGGKEIRSLKTQVYLQIVLENKEGKYQLLCANCNFIKRHENNEWKHKKKFL